LTRSEQWKFARLLVAILIMAILEVVGIASVLPFMQIAANPGQLLENEWLSKIYYAFNFESEREILIASGILVLVLITMSNLFKIFASWLQQKFTWDVSHQLGMRLLRVYLRKSYGYFLTHNTSELLVNLVVEVGKVTTGILAPLCELIAQIIVSLLIFTLLIIVNPAIALITLSVLGVAYVLVYLTRRGYLTRLGKERISLNQHRFTNLKELLGGIKTFRVYGVQDFFYRRYDTVSERFSQIQPRVHLVSITPRHVVEIFAFGGVIVLLLSLISRGQSLQEVLPLLTLYVLAGYRLLPALQKIYGAIIKLRHTYPTVEALEKDLQKDVPLQQSALIKNPIGDFSTNLKLENLSFYYDDKSPAVISNLNVTISKGKTVAFVGSTGSGKTTLVDLMVGLLHPQKGHIKIDDHVLSVDNALTWQNQIAYVPQEVFLFDDTARRNIAIGQHDDEVDQERLERATQVANIHSFICGELPEGYQTIIGEQGVRLSGGQRQRLGLARALYRQPKVLILDEATSALDSITESAVIDSLKAHSEDLTVIVIAHRLSTVRHADCIYLLEKGRIIAEGNYEKLIQKSEVFREMVELG